MHSGVRDLQGVIAVSSILLAPCVVLAFWTFRQAKPNHLVAPWYLLSLAAVCLVGVHLTGIVVAGILWSAGPGSSPNAWEQYEAGWQDDIGSAVFKTVTLCSGLYNLLVVVVCRAAFWEHTNANAVFRRHNTARWILLAFDILLGIACLAMLLSTTATGQTCCEGGSQTAAGLMVGGIFDEAFSYGFPYIIVCGYINATFGAFFLRKWARRYDFGVPIANAMFTFIPPALLAQTVCLIVLTAIYFRLDIAIDVFYTSIPWRVQQIVVLGLLTWILRTRPLRRDNEPKLGTVPHIAQITRATLPAFAT